MIFKDYFISHTDIEEFMKTDFRKFCTETGYCTETGDGLYRYWVQRFNQFGYQAASLDVHEAFPDMFPEMMCYIVRTR